MGQGAAGEGDGGGRGAPGNGGAAVLHLNAEIAGGGEFSDGVAELAGEEDERPFAGGLDFGYELLDERGAAGEAAMADAGAMGTGGDEGLDDGGGPVLVAAVEGEIERFPGGEPDRIGDGDACGCQGGEVAFVVVPADEGGGVDDGDAGGFQGGDPIEEGLGAKMVIPAGADDDGVEGAPVLRWAGPEGLGGAMAGIEESAAKEAITGGDVDAVAAGGVTGEGYAGGQNGKTPVEPR